MSRSKYEYPAFPLWQRLLAFLGLVALLGAQLFIIRPATRIGSALVVLDVSVAFFTAVMLNLNLPTALRRRRMMTDLLYKAWLREARAVDRYRELSENDPNFRKAILPPDDELEQAVDFVHIVDAPRDDLRFRLMPISRKYPLRDLVAAMKRVPLRSGRKVTAAQLRAYLEAKYGRG